MASNSSNKTHLKKLSIILAVIVCAAVAFYLLPKVYGVAYSNQSANVAGTESKDKNKASNIIGSTPVPEAPIPVTHIKTPSVVNAIYISSWTAGLPSVRDKAIKLADDTEINSIVVDVKDSTGRIGFHVSDPALEKFGTVEKRIPDVRALTNMLHQKNIYIIGRVVVFQDPYLAKKKPEWALAKKSDGQVWKDRKGLSFLDPANKAVWDYIVSVARDAYAEGFDEINFDYIRYPSDGNIKDINYKLAPGKTRADNLEAFFKYLSENVKKDDNIPMSADLFGLTTETNDDMGIGQVWEKALPYFDFLAPMIYPSHYPPGQYGFKNPAEHPYEVITHALTGAVQKTTAAGSDIHKIRPWLQDFNLGAIYTKDMVRSQIKAVYDQKLSSWMLWDASNKYTPSALELEKTQ